MLKTLGKFAAYKLYENFAQSVHDRTVKARVEPVRGSVVFCELVFNLTGHSGIYIGNHQIVHLDGSGEIEIVSPQQFLRRLDGWNSAISIYVSCQGNEAMGNEQAAQRAEAMVGQRLDYHLLTNNCHQFTSGCLSGAFEKRDVILLSQLKTQVETQFDVDDWCTWDFDGSLSPSNG